jgi:hypothetical protein
MRAKEFIPEMYTPIVVPGSSGGKVEKRDSEGHLYMVPANLSSQFDMMVRNSKSVEFWKAFAQYKQF